MLYNATHIINESNNDNVGLEMSNLYADMDGTMTFSRDNYTTDAEMYNDMALFIQILIENQNTCKIYADSEGIISVEFGHDEQKEYWGGSVLTWLNEDEHRDVMRKRIKLNRTLFPPDIPDITK